MKEEQKDLIILLLTVSLIVIALISSFYKNSSNLTGNAVAMPDCMNAVGDVNNDGSIDPKDLAIIQEMISGERTKTLCADANEDSLVTQKDIDLLRSRMIF